MSTVEVRTARRMVGDRKKLAGAKSRRGTRLAGSGMHSRHSESYTHNRIPQRGRGEPPVPLGPQSLKTVAGFSVRAMSGARVAAALALIPGTNRGQFHTNGSSADATFNAAECNGFARRDHCAAPTVSLPTVSLTAVKSLVRLKLRRDQIYIPESLLLVR